MTKSPSDTPQGLDLSPTSNADNIYARPGLSIASLDPAQEADSFLRALQIELRRSLGLPDYPDRKPQSAAD